jgi:hypothetical protein
MILIPVMHVLALLRPPGRNILLFHPVLVLLKGLRHLALLDLLILLTAVSLPRYFHK